MASIAWYQASVSVLQTKTCRQQVSQRRTASSAVGTRSSHRMGQSCLNRTPQLLIVIIHVSLARAAAPELLK
jgi:hypothetical protein